MRLKLRVEKRTGNQTHDVEVSGKSSYTLGRANADITVKDPRCSRTHALFYLESETLHYRDLGSTNGTVFNQKRLEGSTPLKKGEFVQIGSMRIVVEEFEHADHHGSEATQFTSKVVVWPQTKADYFVDEDEKTNPQIKKKSG